MPSCAMAQQGSVRQSVQRLRVLFCQPGRRGGSWCTEDHADSFFRTKRKKTVKQVEGIAAFFRLENYPGKFCCPDNTDACFFHPLQIFSPQAFVPLFRIVAYACFIVVPLMHILPPWFHIPHYYNRLFVNCLYISALSCFFFYLSG